jgi:hypothetical protein
VSDFGVLASRFRDGAKSLRRFDEALRYVKGHRKGEAAEREQVQNLVEVMKPVAEILTGRLSANMAIDELGLVEILHQKHERDWQAYKEKVLDLYRKLAVYNSDASKEEIGILSDVADAMDRQCAYLFRRMSGRM